MNVALFSTAYLPPVAYMSALLQYAEAKIEAKETFPKQTYRNRAVIVGALDPRAPRGGDGTQVLSVPVCRQNHSRTEEVTIDYSTPWPIIHLRTLTAAYSAAPYFEFYFDELRQLLLQRHVHLLDLNLSLTRWLLDKLHIPCTLSFTTDFVPPMLAEHDFRSTFSPKVPFDCSSIPTYYQVFADRQPFVPNASVVDLLFNLGPEATAYLKALAK